MDEYCDVRDGKLPSIVTLRGRPDGSSGVDEGSGSDSVARQLDDQMREFIPSELTCSIIDQTPMILNMIKEGIIEIVMRGRVHSALR